MRIGYARVSTQKQNIDRQIVALNDAGADKIFIDKASGKDTNREQFNEMIGFARQSDTIIVSSLDRLGRNYEQVKQILTDLRARDVNVEILDAPFLNFNTGNTTLDAALFDMLTSMLSYIADNERKQLLERQSEGIAVAKTKGIYQGKPQEYSATAKNKGKRAIYHNIVRELSEGQSITKIAKENGVTRKLVYRIKNELEVL